MSKEITNISVIVPEEYTKNGLLLPPGLTAYILISKARQDPNCKGKWLVSHSFYPICWETFVIR